MVKKGRTKYTWQDLNTRKESKFNVKEIYSRCKKRRGLSKYLLSVNVSVSDRDGNSMPAKLVYARNRNNQKDWVCFICTDMDADEEKVLRTYTLRWQVETYFKIVKGYLKLRTECHSTSYDAITSHMVIVVLRYMMLAVERFNNTDNRSIVDIFYNVRRDIENEMMDCAIVIVLDAMLESVRNYFSATENQIGELVADYFATNFVHDVSICYTT